MNLFDYLFGFFIISIVIGFIILIFYGLTMFNFVQLDNLNNRTCELAGIPVENCFCEMVVWGNVMCSQKQQSSWSISTSTTIVRSG